MFARRRGTVIAEGLKIIGCVTADGLVEVNGHIEGELHCTSLIISRKAHINGAVEANTVVVDGRVEGPIQGREVILKSGAQVIGDIQHHALSIESGAYFEGRSVQVHALDEHRQSESVEPRKQVAKNGRQAVGAVR
jgi:cytoskeletal protein CcmA (bactofilin family)